MERIPLRSHSGRWPSLPRFTESDEPVCRGNLQAVLLQTDEQPSLPKFTESDEPVWRVNLYVGIRSAGVRPSLPRFTESDEPVWRGHFYTVILLTDDGHVSLGLQSLMSPW